MNLKLIYCSSLLVFVIVVTFIFVYSFGPTEKVTLPEHGDFPGQCGSNGESDRILSGSATDIYEYNWMALFHYANDEKGKFKCAGTVINKRYILTAAHCVVNKTRLVEQYGHLDMVRLGEWDTTTEKDCVLREGEEDCLGPPTDFEPEEFIPHPNYNIKTNEHDIALIRLSKEVNFTDSGQIRPVCLPNNTNIPEKQNFTVVGWGVTEKDDVSPRKLVLHNLPHFNKENCTKLYSKQRKLGPGQICAGGKKNEDTCSGDSGGPLLVSKAFAGKGSYYYQTGIISFGPTRCGKKDIPAVYTNVAYYMDWILDNMKP